MKKWRRWLAGVLVAGMLIALLPTAALAENLEGNGAASSSVQEQQDESAASGAPAKQEPTGETDSAVPAAPSGDTSAGEDPEPVEDTPSEPVSPADPGTGTAPSEAAAQVQAMIDALPGPESALADETAFAAASDAVAGVESAMSALTEAERQTLQLDHYNSLVQALREYVPVVLDEGSPAVKSYYPEGGVAVQKIWNDNNDDQKRPKNDEFFNSLQLWYSLKDENGASGVLSDGAFATSEQPAPLTDQVLSAMGAGEKTVPTASDVKVTETMVNGMKTVTYSVPANTLPSSVTIEGKTYTVQYSVSEPSTVAGYLPAESDGSLTLKNTLATEITATVEWKDNDNYYGTRPDPSTYCSKLKLYRQVGNGQPEEIPAGNGVTLTVTGDPEGDSYQISAAGLPAYDPNGQPYTYYFELPKDDRETQTQEISQNNQTLDAGEGNPGGLYDSVITNEGNYANETGYLYPGGKAVHTLTNFFYFQVSKKWVDGDAENRPASILHIYRIAENTSDSAGHGSVVMGGNVVMSPREQYAAGQAGVIQDGNGNTIGHIQRGSDGNEQITDPTGAPVGAWYDDGTVRYTDGQIIGTLNEKDELVGALSGHVIGELLSADGTPIGPTEAYSGHIKFFNSSTADFEVIRIVSGSLLEGSPAEGYDNVAMPRSQTDVVGDAVTYDSASDTYTVYVGKNDGTGELPMYDAQGRRYIYYAVEVMANRGDYVSEAENPTTYRPDTLVAAGDDYVLNGGTLTNRLSSPVTVEATKVFDANAIQEMPETKVTMALQKRVVGTNDPWEFVLEDRVPLNRDGAPVTDENQNPLYEATDADGVTKYRHVLTLTGFQSEDLSQSGSLVVDRYDEDGRELEYRWVETAVSMQEANSPIEVKNPDGYYDTGDVITLNPEDSADNIVPGVGANRTTAQFEVEVDEKTGTVTNTLVGNTQVELTKTWLNKDGTPMTAEEALAQGLSTTATFTLYQDGKPMNAPGATVTLDLAKGANQDHIWTQLPRYDENGLEHEYTVVEEPSDGWSSDLVYSKVVVQGDGVDGQKVALTQTNAGIVNQPIGDSIIIDVQKQWLDDGDLNCRRPVEVTLYDRATGLPVADASISNFAAAGGATRTLDASGNWTTRYILSGAVVGDDKTASDFIALETALVVDENISVPVDYYNVRDGITDTKTLIDYLTNEDADGGARLSRLTSTASFAMGEENIAQMIDLLAGHLGYSGENAERAPHYYNVYVGQREDHTDRYACYLLFNQRTGVVYLDAKKTWVDGGDGLPIELGIYRTQKGETKLLETVRLDPQTDGTPTRKDEKTVGYTMTWNSEKWDHGDQSGYGAVLLKPDTGYPKYDFLGRLLEYSIREVQIGDTEVKEGQNTVEIKKGDVTDTYTVTTTAHPPEYGESRHSGDRYSYSITNQKQETYTLSVNKVWQDDGTQSGIGHQNLQSRPDPVYTIYRTTAYTGEELQERLNNGRITQAELLEQSEAITGTMIWNTQHNNWYWGTDRLDSVDRYDSNGRPYVYFLIEKMRANGDGNYSTFYYNANQSNGVDGIDFVPSDNVTQAAADSLVEAGYLKKNGDGTYTDAYGNTVTVGGAPTSTSQVFAPTSGDPLTSSVALIISDGQHKAENGSYSGYWSCTTVNYCEGVRDLSGKKIWSGLPNTGNLLPSEYLPQLTMSLWQTNKAPTEDITPDDLTPVMENGTQRRATATAADNFAFSFGKLPRYDQYGQRIYYYVTEAYVAPAEGGYGKTDISTLPHFDFTFRNVYDGKPSTALTIEKSWPGFDPDTGMREVDGIDRELPQTTTFKLESFMPDVKGYDAPGCHIEEYDCYIQLTVSYPGTGGYDVTAKIVDAAGTEIDSDIQVSVEQDTNACKWTIQVDGLRGYAPNGQKMVYRVTESGKAEGYTVTAEEVPDSPQLVLGENAAQTTGLLETIGDLFVRAFNGLRALFTEAEEPEAGAPTPTSAGTASYTNTYQGETVDYTVTKAWQGDQKNHWNETDRRAPVTVVLCRQWWSDAQGKMLNEVMLENGNPQTATLDSGNNYRSTFSDLTQYAPNGNPYRYYVIEHPEEACSYTPARTQRITFENVPEDSPLSYTSSNDSLNPVTIGATGNWAVSGNYQTKPTAAPADSDTLTNKLPLTSVRLEKLWQTVKDGKTALLTDEDYAILEALGAFPTMLYVDVEKWNGSEWVHYVSDLGHFTLSASPNYSKIDWTFSNSLPKYEDGCNGTEHDGCPVNADGTIDHKVAQYRLVERLAYEGETVQPTFPNQDTVKRDAATGQPTADPYNSELGATGVGTIGNFDSTVVRTVNSDGTTVNTFTNTIPLRPLRVDKIWKDNTNKDGTRPEPLPITLFRDVTGKIIIDGNGDVAGWTGMAGEYDLPLGYVDAVDPAQNHWAKLVYVPLYQNGHSTGSDKYSSYMVIEAENPNTLIQSDGITPVSGSIEMPPSYVLTGRAAGHTSADDEKYNVNDYAALQGVETNRNYFLFTNTLQETARVPLEAKKAFADDSGWDTLTRPTVEFTLEYFNNEAKAWFPASGTSTYTADGTEKTVEASTIVGVLMQPDPNNEGKWIQIPGDTPERQTISIDGNTGSFTWQANRYYPKTKASDPNVEIQYRVVETMKDGAGEKLTIVAPYTGTTVNGGTGEQPTSTITNTLRTVPLNLTKTWADATAFAAALRPDSVTYLVEYRLAKTSVNGQTVDIVGWVDDSGWKPAQIGTPGEDGAYPGTITLDRNNTTQNGTTWTLKPEAVEQLPLFDKDGNLFVYRVSEYSMTYGSGGSAVIYTAVNQTDDGFTTLPTDPTVSLTSTWDGTVGGYTGHVVTAPTLGDDRLPTGWYAGGGTENGSANTNTFETTGLTVEKKVAADNYAEATFPFTVTVDLTDCTPVRDSYAWTVVCQNAGYVNHTHGVQHGTADVKDGQLTINVSLGHGDRLYVHYLPAGADYTVTENRTFDGMAYDTMFEVNGNEPTTQGTDFVTGSIDADADTAEAVLCINRLASLAVVKVDGGGSPLAGAGFTLYDSSGTDPVSEQVMTVLAQKIYLDQNVSGDLSRDGYDPDTGRVYVAADRMEYTVHKESGTVAGTSSYFYYKPLGSPLTDAQNREYLSTGMVDRVPVAAVAEFRNLPVGTYTLKETSVPDGYIRLQEMEVGYPVNLPDEDSDVYNVGCEVVNYKGMALPTTGHGGVLGVVAMGLTVFALGSALLLYLCRLKPVEQTVSSRRTGKKKKGGKS